MKKRFLVAVFVAVAALNSVAAQTGTVAIGPIYSVNFLGISSPLGGLGVTGKAPGLAPLFGLNFSFGSEKNFLGVTADWLMYKQPLYQPFNLNFYMGPGLYSSLLLTKPENRFDFGLRIPVGVNWVPVKFVEVFLEVTPAFGITIRDPVAPSWLFQSAAGARVWF